MVSPARLCLLCKGSRRLCGWRVCPLLSRKRVIPKIKERIGNEFFGPSTSVFIGHNFYPNVYVGPLASLDSDHLETIDSPRSWFGKPYSNIIEMRSFVLRSKQRENVFSRSRFVENTQELALAKKPTDVELEFKKKPTISFEYSDIVQPMGPSASLKKMRITENPVIPRKTERVVNDELKAEEAGFLLYKQAKDVYKVSNILSSGILGLEKSRKLVPTRWSITATDDIIFKRLVKKVKEQKQINDYFVFSSEYLDNHFSFLLMPGNWEFENFEAWSPGSTWSFNLKKTEILEEYEPFHGRTKYANLQAGGYYASRLAVIEYLNRIGKQARVVGFREIHEGYTIPLGVWVVRETARNAFLSKPSRFETLRDALKHIDSKLRLNITEFIRKSRILRQRRLGDFN
ncbi:MAG: hypothetical protein GTN38_03400 [Candidatus Aenigmarchaeota archaeon]|nr:hypothetical protein [Candidatus Aenigmarchaeota archaeon]NIP40708.1 hypothetical protein [Candidatus Aenigmarchaeota archaeon]NIQ18514.1 hypothetical protein [Candidatus Aenigmarchaeota archaeon]NIS73413.1 hypothetical protein [Candidatus Aenigmarchaeota archaeon]